MAETQRCVACGRRKVRGLTVRGMFLCKACEVRAASISVDDPGYERLVQRLHAFWRGLGPESAGGERGAGPERPNGPG